VSLNYILEALDSQDADWLRPHLIAVELKARQPLERSRELIERVFFIETGIAAVIGVSGNIRIGLALIGCEGMSGLALLLGNTQSLHSTVMLSDGTARLITADALRGAIEHRPELRRLLLRYALAFHQQVAHTALSNAKSSIPQRVARWVLMTHDRVAKDNIPLTHKVIADTLGVRRAGVSVALQALQKAGLISIGHGQIHILSRQGLRAYAGHFYGVPEKDFNRLVVSRRDSAD